MSYQFNLPPAPAVRPRFTQVNLGKYSPEHEGWIVVFDIDAELSNNEHAFNIADNRLSGKDRMDAMYAWLEGACVAWNFTKTTINAAGDEETVPLKQPRDGGTHQLPQSLLKPLSEAFAEVSQASKN
jgi:hypothetical protein